MIRCPFFRVFHFLSSIPVCCTVRLDASDFHLQPLGQSFAGQSREKEQTISIEVVERIEREEAHLWFDGGAEGAQEEGVP